MTNDQRDRFRSRIGNFLEIAPDQVTLFAKGRVALYAILRALDIGPGDEVVLPAFTCVAVPNAVLYTGARPVWVDIDPETFCLDPAAVESAINPKTRAVLAQNTFGLSADLDAIMAATTRDHITVIDDCTHGLGGRYHGKPNGATAPLSFFSTQWSKPMSTGLGGFAIDRDGAAADRLRALELAAAEPSTMRVAALRTLLFGRERAGRGRLLRGGRAIYRAFGRLGVVPGSSSQDELEGATMPDGFLAGLSEWQARIGSERIGQLQGDIERRRLIAHRYSESLVAQGRTPAAEPAEAEHSFLRYPIRVADRQRFMTAAARAGVEVGDWFVSPVHPVEDHFERWGYVAGAAPNAEKACRQVVNLPTDSTLVDRDVERVLALIARCVDIIM